MPPQRHPWGASIQTFQMKLKHQPPSPSKLNLNANHPHFIKQTHSNTYKKKQQLKQTTWTKTKTRKKHTSVTKPIFFFYYLCFSCSFSLGCQGWDASVPPDEGLLDLVFGNRSPEWMPFLPSYRSQDWNPCAWWPLGPPKHARYHCTTAATNPKYNKE